MVFGSTSAANVALDDDADVTEAMTTNEMQKSSNPREASLIPEDSCMVVVDMQNYACHPEGGAFNDTSAKSPSDYFKEMLPKVVENISALQYALRECKVEICYTTIESLTKVCSMT